MTLLFVVWWNFCQIRDLINHATNYEMFFKNISQSTINQSQLKTLLRIALINFRIPLLKILKLPALQILYSRLFFSVTAQGKKTMFLQIYVSFQVNRNVFCISIVHRKCLKKITRKKHNERIPFCKICKSSIALSISNDVEETLALILRKVFHLKYHLLLITHETAWRAL